MPAILAIDNSTNYLSLAYVKDKQDLYILNKINIYHEMHINNASNYILQQINLILGLDKPDYIALGIGPGGFTGVRLACSIAMGLALAWNIPVIPICSLHASLEYFRYCNHNNLSHFNGRILIDARMQEMYTSIFSYENNAWNVQAIELISSKYLFTDKEIFTNMDIDSIASITNNSIIHKVEVHALGVLSLAFDNINNACLPEQIRPNYVRNKVALTISERQERQT